MKRLIPILLIFAISCNKQQTPDSSIVHHNYLCLEDAKEEVNSLIKDIDPIITRAGQPGRRVIRSSWTKKLIPGTRASDNPSADLYILNFEDSLGFAIVSSNPAKSILGLALSGSLEDGDDIDNPGLAITLANLEAYAKIPTRVDSIAYYEYGPWIASNYIPYTGYCPVKWKQGSSWGDQYNAYCPTVNGMHCPAGCVAVATAQLMAMYKYPSYQNSYYYDWDSMIQYSTAQNGQGEYYVGRLLQQLGLPNNLNMNYSLNGSGSFSSLIPQTLENFGYSNGGSYHYFYSLDLTELRNGYPIIMRGETTSNEGHAWLGHGLFEYSRTICGYGADGELLLEDGETQSFILCNFGWGGIADGFYSSWAFTTTNGPVYPDPNLISSSIGSYDFPYDIRCVSGIRRF